MVLPTGGTLRFSDINAALFFTAGNVGVNTTNPASLLDVNGILNATTYTGSNLSISGSITSSTILASTSVSSGGLYAPRATVSNIVATTVSSGSYYASGSYVTVYNGVNGAMSPLNGSFLTIESFTTGNTVKLPVLISPYGGGLGIGTTSPALSLHVKGTNLGNVMRIENANASYNSCLEFTNDNSTSYIGLGGSSSGNILSNRLFFQSPQDMHFAVNGGTNAMFMNTSGNIGIGITSPSYTLDVNGPIRVGGQINFNWGSTYQKLIDVTWTGFWDQVRIYTPGNLTGNPKMYLQPNGVGIGVQPGYTFHLGGETDAYPVTFQLDETAHATSNRASMKLGNWLLTQDISGNGARNFGIYDYGTSAWRMSIATGGNIGIGTNSPESPLHVVAGSAWAWPGAGYYFTPSSNIAYVSADGISSNNSILADGGITSKTGFYSSSDVRIKKSITDINDVTALSVLRQVEPKRYNYIDEVSKGSTPVWGFIAQQIETVLDYAVTKSCDFIPDIYDFATLTPSTVGTILTLAHASTSIFNVQPDKMIIVRLHSSKKGYQLKLKEVIDDHTFVVDDVDQPIQVEESDEGKIFVYGQQVDDFHRLNKDAIFTVAVAALQEVDRELQDTKDELNMLKAFIQSKFPGEL